MLSDALLISSLVLAAAAPAGAQDMKRPQVWVADPDWHAAASELEALIFQEPHSQHADSRNEAELTLAAAQKLNAQTDGQFPNISASPIPVLLPFDTAAFLSDRSGPTSPQPVQSGRYLFGFNAIPFFYAGPTGYDAVIVARAGDMRDLRIFYSTPIYVHVSGFSFLYKLPEPVGVTEWPVNGLDEFAVVRRVILEDSLRYSFVRYGVSYVISIDCIDGISRYGKISCRDADNIALRTLTSLRLVGGSPHKAHANVSLSFIERPVGESAEFTYYSPGDLIPGTGFKNSRGMADYTVFFPMRFPIAQAPAFANSQSFLNAGDCEGTGWSSMGIRDGMAAYRCRINTQALLWNEGTSQNYAYPWRDNFCETRHFPVGQCPAGSGHQGQDIRPASCPQRNPGDRCEPNLYRIVAVRDGMVLRAPGQHSLQLVANAVGVRARLRYLHMSPKQLDADGLVNGRLVREGDVIGKVGNFLTPRAPTTAHLHFDLQVPSKLGWVFANPYMTLVASYEWLIGRRGREIKEQRSLDGNSDQVISTLSPSSLRNVPASPAGDRIEAHSEFRN